MRCFYCGGSQNIVVDKREVKASGDIRRRRECIKCHNRFTTYEKILNSELFVIKRDGRKELFDKKKLLKGIEKALEKRAGLETAEQIVEKVIAKIKTKGKKEVETKMIGKTVLCFLKETDPIAYLRFASVYRHFNKPGDFRKELEQLKI